MILCNIIDEKAAASNDNLLCLFAITGGVPKYVEA